MSLQRVAIIERSGREPARTTPTDGFGQKAENPTEALGRHFVWPRANWRPSRASPDTRPEVPRTDLWVEWA